MKKNIFLLSVFIITLTLCACTAKNEENINYDSFLSSNLEEEKENPNVATTQSAAPLTLTDLFDGEQRIWFYVDGDKPKYDSAVKALFITENKKVTAMYYNLTDNYSTPEQFMNLIDISMVPNPFSNKRFCLGDFSGLSNDEIIKLATETYADASSEYSFMYDPGYGGSTKYTLKANNFPYEIKYSGTLDNSGNNLKSETLKFFENDYTLPVASTSVLSEHNYKETITPITIKDKEYVGFSAFKLGFGEYRAIVTLNNYSSFGALMYDSVENKSEF